MRQPITDLEAKQIAADWHGGQWCPIYAFLSTGAIRQQTDTLTPQLMLEIDANMAAAKARRNTPEYNRLYRLRRYVEYRIAKDDTGPVDGWHDLHW
jgi:hypothetical protein